MVRQYGVVMRGRLGRAVGICALATVGMGAGMGAGTLCGAAWAEAPAPTSPPTAQPTAAPPAAPALTAADFAALPFVEEPALSPNGEYMAGLFGVNGARDICIIALFEKDAKLKCLGVPDKVEPHGVEWVGNDNIIVHLTMLLPVSDKDWYVSRLMAVNRLTGKYTKLFWDFGGQNADDVLWTAQDGTPTALVAAQNSIYTNYDGFWPSVYRVNVETGDTRTVQTSASDVMDWVADGAGRVRMGVSDDDDHRSSRLLYRGETGFSMRTIDRADGKKRESLLAPVGFVPGSDHGLVYRRDYAEDGKSWTSGIYEIDLLTQKDVAQIWAAPAGTWISGVEVDKTRSKALAVWLKGALDKKVWLDPVLAQVQADFERAVPDRQVNIAAISDDQSRMLVVIDRPDTPGALYFYDTTEGKLHRLAFMNEHLRTAPLNPVRLIHYKARDGLAIEGVLTTPKGRAEKALPVIVMPHGGPWAHDRAAYDYWAQFLASLGYLVIQPNFRGSTGYGEDFERAGEGQMGLAMQDDINDALAWAVKEGIADPKRACIVGASYGGYATMWGLARDADLWRCGISIAGVSNERRELNYQNEDNLNEHSNHDAWSRMTPDFAAISPINFVDKIKAPLLLIHGKKDVTVDYGQSASMNAKMMAAGKRVEFVSLPLADHHFTRAPDRLQLLGAMAAFLKANNPPDP